MPKYMHIHTNLDIDSYLQMSLHNQTLLTIYRFKTTFDFPNTFII